MKLHKKNKHDVPQLDGSEFISEEKEVETQTDVFLSIDIEGEIIGTELANIYSEPPSSVYHPIKGTGKFQSISQAPEIKEKYYCYEFEDGRKNVIIKFQIFPHWVFFATPCGKKNKMSRITDTAE